jgi:hypothetical protein
VIDGPHKTTPHLTSAKKYWLEYAPQCTGPMETFLLLLKLFVQGGKM